MKVINFDIQKNDSYQIVNWYAPNKVFTAEVSTLEASVEGFNNSVIRIKMLVQVTSKPLSI